MRIDARIVLLTAALGIWSAPAQALPRAEDVEEAYLDGDLDHEDVIARGGHDVARSAPGGHAWVSIVGFTNETATGAHDVGGMIVVGMPLDRIARVATGRQIGDPPVPKRAPPAPPPPPPPPPKATPPPPAPEVPATEAAVKIVLTPQVARACVAAAWRASGLGADDARVDAIVSRARWSGLLPETRLRAIRWDDDHLYSPYLTDPTQTPRESTGARLGLEARLTWRLDRLLFAEDEPSFERLKLDRQDARARVAGRTLEALFHWQRGLLEVQSTAESTRERFEAALRVAEAEATLDVLTNGWFGVWRSERDP